MGRTISVLFIIFLILLAAIDGANPRVSPYERDILPSARLAVSVLSSESIKTRIDDLNLSSIALSLHNRWVDRTSVTIFTVQDPPQS
jgi:hypothetical protein